MESVTIYRHGQLNPVLKTVWHARSPWQRLRGLLGRRPLSADEGLLLSPCRSVHTLGMGYPLDIVFLDPHGRVVKCVAGLKSYRTAASRQAHHTLELAAGTICDHGLKPGDRLNWKGNSFHNGASGEVHQ
jgi:uncharacterized membrane protein (UPF0127 family)